MLYRVPCIDYNIVTGGPCMGEKVKLSVNKKYVLVQINGSLLSLQEFQSILSKVIARAIEYQLNIIIHRESPVLQRLSLFEIYDIALFLRRFTFRKKLALVYPEEMHEDNFEFFINAPRNRGVQSGLFSTLENALDWIG
jgi:hypothetical protein